LSPPERKTDGPRDRASGPRPRRRYLKSGATIKKKIIAVIDDDEAIRKAAVQLLSAFGFGTETFASPDAFLNAMTRSEAVCLVIDIQLAGMSGLELAHRLREDGFRRPVIFLTAVDDEAIRREVAAAGGHACLKKPFATYTLIEEIIRAIG
jgi:FixJ family two-component response regulator